MLKVSPGNVKYSVVTIINNTVLYILKLPRWWISKDHNKKKKIVIVCGDGC